MLTHRLLREHFTVKLKKAKKAAALKMCRRAQKEFKDLADMQLTDKFTRELLEICLQACDVLDYLRFHPATFAVDMPLAYDVRPEGCFEFLDEWREDIAGVDDKDLPASFLGGTAFPAIIKRRNEDGKKIADSYICKAKVLAVTQKQLDEFFMES